MPCRSCPRRRTCREICHLLEAKLPRLQDNLTHGHTANPNRLMNLAANRKAACAALDRRVRLHGREREVLDMVLNRSMSTWRAARLLRMSRKYARKVLGRAIARKSRKAAVNTERSPHELPGLG